MNKIELIKIDLETLKKIWEIGFTEEAPEWKQWDGPCFDYDYKKYDSFEEFSNSQSTFFLRNQVRCILVNGEPIGFEMDFKAGRKSEQYAQKVGLVELIVGLISVLAGLLLSMH